MKKLTISIMINNIKGIKGFFSPEKDYPETIATLNEAIKALEVVEKIKKVYADTYKLEQSDIHFTTLVHDVLCEYYGDLGDTESWMKEYEE